jgi:hypothetical protein
MMVTFPLTMVAPRYNLKGGSLRHLCQIAPLVLTRALWFSAQTQGQWDRPISANNDRSGCTCGQECRFQRYGDENLPERFCQYYQISGVISSDAKTA